MSTSRIVKRKDQSDWTAISLKELKKYDVFTMFEPDGEQVGGEWVAVSDPTVNDMGVWGVVADERTN